MARIEKARRAQRKIWSSQGWVQQHSVSQPLCDRLAGIVYAVPRGTVCFNGELALFDPSLGEVFLG